MVSETTAPAAVAGSPIPAVRLTGLSKRFGQVRALDDVSFDVVQGEVHGLVGLNGSGKSTLIKILAGYYSLDEGEIKLPTADGQWVTARGAEMAFVHQDLGLIPTLTVVENMFLGRTRPLRRGRIDQREERARACEVLARFGIEHLWDQRVSALSRAEATIVAMARALERQREERIRLLVLDEPTSALPKAESENLLRAMREVTSDGTAVLFVSHRMAEIHETCDRITALRNGSMAWSGSPSDTDEHHLLAQMVGRRDEHSFVDEDSEVADVEPGQVVVELRSVSSGVLRDIDLKIRAGEVVGVTGILGSGVDELGLVVSGRVRPTRGLARLGDDEGAAPTLADLRSRIGLVPGDRLHQGILPTLSITANVTLPAVDRFVRRSRISAASERKHVETWIRRLQVKTTDQSETIGNLSGGNQQKCVLARWLGLGVDALVAIEPTQGIDVHAKKEVLAALTSAAAGGMAVALFSHDPDEIFNFCHRIVVLVDGEIAGDLARDGSSIHDVLALMAKPSIGVSA